MRPTKLFLFVVTLFVGSMAFSQSQMFMDPPEIYLGAEETNTVGALLFEGEALPWTAEVTAEWLRVFPLEGEGPSDILFEADPNMGPRRMAQVIFTPADATLEPLVVYVWHEQFLPPDAFSLEVNRIEFIRPGIQDFLPLTGMVNTSYMPFEQDVYFNLMGRLSPDHEPVWLITNAWMPSAFYNPNPQSMSYFFSFYDITPDPALLGEMMEFSWTISWDPFDRMPFVPEPVWELLPVIPYMYDAIGRVAGLSPTPADFLQSYWPMLLPPFEITDVVYIGCDMPNGDLVGSEHDGYDVNGCGPAAASNSMHWLEKEHPEIEFPNNWRESFEQMGTLMDRDSGQTVGDRDFIRAKLDFIEMYDLPIKVKYQANTLEGDINSSSGNSSADDQDGAAGDAPTDDWLKNELDEDEDVEIGVGYDDGTGHWVAATGTVTINGEVYVFFKHDTDQTNKDSTKQQPSWLDQSGDVMRMPGLGNGKVEIVVSESYDPDHEPVPDTETFDEYCKSFKRTIPPKSSITITYPEDDDRCFNTTVRVLNRAGSDSYENEATWNFNSGKSRTYKNNTGQPITVEFHNDDHYDGGEPLKNYHSYEVNVSKVYNDEGGVTDPSNEEAYAGFSIGSNDDSSREFGVMIPPAMVYNHGLGSRLKDFPAAMRSGGVETLRVNYAIPAYNNYWQNLGLVLGISEIIEPVEVLIESESTGYSETILIDHAGTYRRVLGEQFPAESFFDISFTIQGEGGFYFDNVGIPSLVQVAPILEVNPAFLLVESYTVDTTFRIQNLGGSNMNWSISKSEAWFDVLPMSGTNEAHVTVQFTPNNGPTRSGTITINAPGARNAPAYVMVQQEADLSYIDLIESNQFLVEILPNPNQGDFMLSLKGIDVGEVHVRVMNLSGQTVYEQVEETAGEEYSGRIKMEAMEAGVYFIEVRSGERKVVKKFMLR